MGTTITQRRISRATNERRTAANAKVVLPAPGVATARKLDRTRASNFPSASICHARNRIGTAKRKILFRKWSAFDERRRTWNRRLGGGNGSETGSHCRADVPTTLERRGRNLKNFVSQTRIHSGLSALGPDQFAERCDSSLWLAEPLLSSEFGAPLGVDNHT